MNTYTQPNYKTSAVITIDAQCCTLDGQALGITGTSAAVPNMKRVLDVYRKRQMPVVHIVRIYKADSSNVELCRKQTIEAGAKVFLQGTAGCELAPGLFDQDNIKLDSELLLSGNVQDVSDYESIIYKPRWGAFFKTPLESHLKKLGVDTLVFVGCNFPNCPRASIIEASERDFKIVLVADAVSGVYPKGIEEMLGIGVVVVSADDVVDAVNG